MIQLFNLVLLTGNRGFMNHYKITLLLSVLIFADISWAQLSKVTPGKSASSKLKMKQSKVPSYDFQKNKEIPRLDIGEEAELKFESKPLVISEKPNSKLTINKLVSPKQIEGEKKGSKLAEVQASKSIANKKTLTQIPAVEPLKETYQPKFNDSQVETKELVIFKKQEYKILEGQIYYDFIKNYEMALSHFAELLKDKEFGLDSTYFYGLAAKELKLTSEFKESMLKVAAQSKSKEFKTLALEELTNFVSLLEIGDIENIDPLVVKEEFDIQKKDTYNFYRAKYYLEKGQLGQVEDALSMINQKSEYFPESRFISALSAYRQGKVEEARDAIDELLKSKNPIDSIKTLATLTLARINFQKQLYKEASDLYLKVDKEHPLWLQAMVEQAWTQILTKDYVGAAGNMFSLHTDFFKNAYNPESYVVRTVSYLNLCQFGDGIQVLSALGKKYAPYFGRVDQYSTTRAKSIDYYTTIKTWLKNPELREVDGLPRSFILELARHPSFVTIQKEINKLEDEITQFNQVSLKLIQREKDLVQKQADLGKELAAVRAGLLDPKKNHAILKEQEIQIQKKQLSFKYQLQGIKTARDTVKVVRDVAFARIDKEKVIEREKAGVALKNRMVQLKADLKELLDQNELLQYEIYSGAGEHLRFQSVSQDTKGKDEKAKELLIAQMQKEKDKKVKWNFKGEIWEDEIGHFRSSLENVCPKEEE